MKILSGKFRSRRIPFHPRLVLRPTSDKVRQAIMNTLSSQLPGARILDLFCGTGSLGLEALSRGAQSALFIEQDRALSLKLRKLISSWHLESQAAVIQGDAFNLLHRLFLQGLSFDIIFADPPYRKGYPDQLLSRLNKNPLLRIKGWLVIETSKHEIMEIKVGDFFQKRKVWYGDTCVYFYKYNQLN